MSRRDVGIVRPGEPLPQDTKWVVFAGPEEQFTRSDLVAIANTPPRADIAFVGARARARRVVDVGAFPQGLVVDRAVVGFRRSHLVEHALRPEEAVERDLAIPLLIAQSLAASAQQTIALAPGRRIAPATPDWQRVERYTVVPQRYVDLLAAEHERRGRVPAWLQHLVATQLLTYLAEDSRLYMTTAALPPEATDAFHRSLVAILPHLDDSAILGAGGPDVTDDLRMALLLGARGRAGHAVPHIRRDPGRGLLRVNYLFAGAQPEETITVGGLPYQPSHAKIRSVDVLGRPLLSERIAWIPQDAILAVDPDGEIALPAPPPPSRIARYRRILAENRGVGRRVLSDLGIRRTARGARARERYADAWLLMDRDTTAQDNAEHLYRHLREHEPTVNAWFVLARDSADWDRLAQEGFRLIDYGSSEHFVALLNCVHLASSQVDSYVVNPFRRHLLGPGRWRFTFLQHGVIKHDLSRWLNAKPIDAFVTTTQDEHNAIVDDGTPYVFTDLEVVLTGLPRHDRLLRLGERGDRTRLVVMPTWRRELLGEQTVGNQRALLDGFWESGYAVAWRELLGSARLRELCERAGWQVTFIPHPNMQDYLATSPLPDHVQARRFSDVDIQQVLSEAAVLLTDYSSLAIEAAYIRRPVVYYQFDRATFFSGGHLYRLGDWSYEQQGYGPITETTDATLRALEELASGAGADPEYAARMERAFAYRDGRCCERTVAAMRRIDRR